MDKNQLIEIVKKKILDNIRLENIIIEDKTLLHKSHKSHTTGRFHLKITIFSNELKSKNKIDANKTIYKILSEEIKLYIHSLQIILK